MLSATHGWSCSGTLYSTPEKKIKPFVQNKKNIKILCNNFRQCVIISLMKENIHMVFLLNVIIICFNLLSHCFLSEHYFGCVCEYEYLMHFLLIYLIFLCMLNVCNKPVLYITLQLCRGRTSLKIYQRGNHKP